MSYTVNCSILFTELPLLQRPAAAKAAGFNSVEFWWPFSSSTPVEKEIALFEHAITDADVQLTGLNFNAGDMRAGDRGLLSLPARSQEFRDNLPVIAGIGERLGCKGFNALYGNRTAGSTPEEQDALAVENLVLAAEALTGIGGTVLVEAVSGAAQYPLKTAADALAVIERVKSRGIINIKFLADFFHLAVNGDDVPAVIENHAADFGHIQIADAPGRGAPGSGGLPIDAWLESSRSLGYTGVVGLEYKAPAATAFDWTGARATAK